MKLCDDLLIRPVNPQTDTKAIAKYIYETDDYIYPALVPAYDDKDWVDFIEVCLRTPHHLFSADNILVADYNDSVIGLICTTPCTENVHFTVPFCASFCQSHSFRTVKEQYFDPLLRDLYSLEGYCIVNLCIDNQYGRRGVASRLIEAVKRSFPHQTLYLDVVKDNLPAVRLYEKSGFTCIREYMGFGGSTPIPCLQMQYP